MIKDIINLENSISTNLKDADPILGKQNIKKIIIEMLECSSWERIDEIIPDEKQISYEFLNQENNMKIYNILYSICKENNYNVSDLISQISLLSAKQNIVLDGMKTKKYICCACICGFVGMESLQFIEIEKEDKLNHPPQIIESVYLIENILCSIYGGNEAKLSDKEITVGVNLDMEEFWKEYMLYNIDRMLDSLKIVNSCQEFLKSKTSIEEEINIGVKQINKTKDEASEDIRNSLDKEFKKHVNSFYGKTMEIIGIFIAIFSLINLNLFSKNDMDIINILILNLSCILGIVVMFFLIKHILDENLKSYTFIGIIAILVIAILILA